MAHVINYRGVHYLAYCDVAGIEVGDIPAINLKVCVQIGPNCYNFRILNFHIDHTSPLMI